jgi:hypothetical protein
MCGTISLISGFFPCTAEKIPLFRGAGNLPPVAARSFVAEQLREFAEAAGRVPAPAPVQTMKGGYQIQVAGINPPQSFRERTEVYEA